MNKLKIYFSLFIFFLLAHSSCKDEPQTFEINYYEPEEYEVMSQYLDIPPFPLDYTNRYPNYYRSGMFGRFDKDMSTLGRVLFYDKNLSADQTISCSSCHKQELAFGDDVDFSLGVEGRMTNRNALALGAVFSFQEIYGLNGIPFFWDNRTQSEEGVALQSFTNENKMGMEMQQVVDAIKGLEYYSPLFQLAFGSREVTEDKILESIATFVNSMGSFNSKYDQALDDVGFELNSRGDNYPVDSLPMFSLEENNGLELYLDNCASCHGGDNGLPRKTQANNGLDIEYADHGVSGITNSVIDLDKFKVPTLHNIMITAPYMHDGRFATIEEVLNHYSSGIQMHPNLDGELKNGNAPIQMNFTDEEKANLIAFFNTFTDSEVLTAERYSDPFKD